MDRHKELERIVLGNGCESEISMAGANFSALILKRSLAIDGSLPRAMGNARLLRSSR
jgi:hypothetical protein